MNQTLIYDFDQVIPLTAEAGLFPSLCTIQAVPGTVNAMGVPIMTFSDVSGLVNIPCHSAPQSNTNLKGSSEDRLPDRTDETQERHVLLDGYFAAIQINMRAVIDGQAWNIIGIDSDFLYKMTRLLVQSYKVSGEAS